MLWIKEYSHKRVILTDGIKEYELICKNENDKFDKAILEEILRDYPNIKEEKHG